MRIILIGTAAACAAALSGCQTTAERERMEEAALNDVRPVGAPVDCLRTSEIRSTTARSDNVIDFEMVNGDIYRNTLSVACPNLKSENRILYRSNIGQLCSIDTITVLQQSGVHGPTCGLEQFQKIERTQ